MVIRAHLLGFSRPWRSRPYLPPVPAVPAAILEFLLGSCCCCPAGGAWGGARLLGTHAHREPSGRPWVLPPMPASDGHRPTERFALAGSGLQLHLVIAAEHTNKPFVYILFAGSRDGVSILPGQPFLPKGDGASPRGRRPGPSHRQARWDWARGPTASPTCPG